MLSIAIDGPAGAGKSSIAKMVARKMGITYVDTGAMYRAVALSCILNSIPMEDEASIAMHVPSVIIEIRYDNGEQRVILNGEDVSGRIRDEEVGKGASAVARFSAVRTRLVELQRELAEKQDVIMDGRDIGTVVLPNAGCKIFLTASSKVRAKRRFLELKEKGEECDIDEIERDIIARDEQDMNREISPLKQADDAILLDTSDMTIDEVVNRVMEIAAVRNNA
ncbi:MAG: (d)CMP kinase [Eubacterium sp.]|nr:(d)CMP kinase [Eubacterium sp.]